MLPDCQARRPHGHDGTKPPIPITMKPVIESISVVDAIEAHIKGVITSGSLKPGQQLPSERDLQKQLGVSRLPLREALARLQALGLIRIHHGKGAFVENYVSRSAMSDVLITFFSNQNIDRLRELIEARAFLESELTALATQKATPADLDKLDELARSDPEVEADPEALADADYAFHHEIARISGNSFLGLMHAAVGPHVRSFLIAYAQSEKERRGVCARNRQLAAAIRAGNAVLAAQAAREHLQPCLRSITETVARIPAAS